LPVVLALFVFKMSHLDLAALRPDPLKGSKAGACTDQRIKAAGLIPQSARIENLGRRAAKEYRVEIRVRCDVTKRLEK
jgi:hypothetical protein